jgi:hypothetical protein
MEYLQLILSRIEERLIPSLLIILIMAALANPVYPWHHVKPPLFATHAISHLLSGKCLVEFPLDGKVFFIEGRLLVVTCKPGRRFVEFARRAFFRKGLPTGPADRVSCKTRASTGTAASRRGGGGWWPSSGEHRANAREPRWNRSLVMIDSFHLFVLGTLSLRLSRLRRWWEVGTGVLEDLWRGRGWESARFIGRLLLPKQITHIGCLGGSFAVATLEAMASLDGRNLSASSSHFKCIRSDTAAFMIALGENAVREVLPWGRGRTKG